jgi:membrane protein implicated in regulation of membrane protease activity
MIMPDLAQLYSAHALWFWLGAGAALLAVEVATGSGWLLWPAASAAVVGLLAKAAGLSPAQAVLVFALLTIVSTLLARRYFPRSLTGEGADINDNVSRLMGHQGRAVTAFEGQAGRVFIDGKEWAAELENGEGVEAGASVKVVGVQGSRLRVRSI